MVSVVVIAVAVAFFMNVLSVALIQQSIVQGALKRVRQSRRAAVWVTRLSQPGTVETILTELGAVPADKRIIQESRNFAGLSEAQTAALIENAQLMTSYLNYFNRIDYGHRRVLIHGTEGIRTFDHLRSPKEWTRFEEAMNSLRLPRFVTPVAEFHAFLDRWPSIRETALLIRKGREKAIARISKSLGKHNLLERLTETDGTFGDCIRESGFAFDRQTAGIVRKQARRIQLAAIFEESIARQDIRQAVAARLNTQPNEISPSMLWNLLSHQRDASWYLDILHKSGLTEIDAKPEHVIQLATIRKEERVLSRAEGLMEKAGADFTGLGRRTKWLLFVSMLVCAVGITNAMLMSVTERFREIATLKCLGALDGSIMAMFVLEASLLGAIGGFLGTVVGTSIGLSRMLIGFGSFTVKVMPLSEILTAMLISTGLGIVLAGAAAVFPSLKAARLAPMEAMRIE